MHRASGVIRRLPDATRNRSFHRQVPEYCPGEPAIRMISSGVMPEWLQASEVIRLEAFLAGFVLIGVLERLLPNRTHQWRGRATGNIGLQLVNALVQLAMLLAAPLTLSAVALIALFSQFGLLNNLQMGLWTKIVIAWLVLDLASYWWHRAWHGVPLLWRFHRIHHLDPALDVLTTFRTHPVETVLTILFKGSIVYLLGVPLLGVILYEVVVAVMALWIHGNVRIRPGADRFVALLLITPGLHRIHHGALESEYSRNFGLVLSLWDRIFGTYRASHPETESGPGISSPDTAAAMSLSGMLWLPFRKTA